MYSYTTPLWGYFDETRHYEQARYIALNQQLPSMLVAGQPSAQPSQPPAYYVLAALPIMLVDVSDNLQARFTAGGPTPVVPNRTADRFPYSGTALALRLTRLVSTLLGVIAICFTYKAIRIALPNRPKIALMAAALQAWWPQFVMSSAAVNNDVAIALWGAIVFWIAMKLHRSKSLREHCIWFGVMAVVSLASLAIKATGMSLIIFAAFFVVLHTFYWMRNPTGQAPLQVARHGYRFVPLGLFFGAWFLCVILGLWFARATVEGIFARLFFDMATGDAVYVPNKNITTQLLKQLEAGALLSFKNWTAVFKSLFAVFGWGSLELPEYWYRVALFAASIPVFGVVNAIYRHKQRSTLLIGLLLIGSSLLVGQLWLSRFSLVQPVILTSIPGRYLLPALSAIVFVIAYGLSQLPTWGNQPAQFLVLAGIALTAIATPFLLFIPAYRPYVSYESMPEVQLNPPITFGQMIQLRGYSLPSQQTNLNCTNVTLYWYAIAKPDADYALSLQVLDARLPDTSFIRTPGNGNLPTGDWQMGDTFAETYCVPRRDFQRRDAPFKVEWLLQSTLSSQRPLRLPALCGQGACEAITLVK